VRDFFVCFPNDDACDLGVPMGPVIATIHERRAELRAEIKAVAPQAELRPLGRRRLRDMLPRAG
jgi:monovalent cation:H+ antiporter-2, CPA2 family